MQILKTMGRAFILVMAVCIFVSSSTAQQTQRINILNGTKSNLDGSQVLPNHVPQEVVRGLAVKIAPASDSQMIDLRIMLPSKDQAGLDTFIKDLYDSKSPNYHKFLTPDQFDLMYGASSTDSAIIEQYLTSQGLTVKGQSKNGFFLTVTGPVSKIGPAFKVNITNYKRADGTTFFSPDVNPTLAPQVAGKIYGIVGMDNAITFYPHNHRKGHFAGLSVKGPSVGANNLHASTSLSPTVLGTAAPKMAITLHPMIAPAFSGPSNTVEPSDILTAYNLNSVASTGSGQTLGLFELDGYLTSDITTYESNFSLPNVPLTNIFTDGFSGTAGDSTFEDVLDIDLSIAVAPGLAGINVYQAPNSGGGWVDQWDRIANDDAVKVISCSWGGDEADSLPFYDHTVFSQLAAQGQTVFVSAGDDGAYDNCQNGSLPPSCTDSGGNPLTAAVSVDDPASDPYITGVGISILTPNGNGTYNNETASLQGGGGISSYVSIPSYQVSAASQAAAGSMVSTTMRNVPDVSLTGDPATSYVVYVTNPILGGGGPGWYYIWGSSASSPIWASFVVRVNQGRVAAGQSVIGFINPVLYQVAQSGQYTADFHDITTGNNSLYPAGAAYDDATGLGSFNGANLYTDLVGPGIPSALGASAGNTHVVLSWTASAGAASYNVKRAVVSGGPYTTVSTSGAVTTTNYTDNSLTNGTAYFYVISAVNAAGIESANSSEAAATPMPLSAPTALVAVAGNAQVGLSWTASAGAVSYNVKSATTSGGPYTTISTSGAVTVTNYTDNSVTNGTTYFYVVSAVNPGGESANSSEANATPLAPPAAPTGLVATAGNTQESLNWNATGGAISYNVKRATVTGGPYTTVSSAGVVVGPSYTDNGLTNGTPYFYVVSAVNAGGEGPNSGEITSTPSVTLPIAPTGLIVSPGNAQVVLNWTASAGATSYNIKRAITNDGPYITISTPGAVTTATYIDTALTNGTTYFYVVSAVNGTGEGANSPQLAAAPLAPPLAPTGVVATPGEVQAILNWTATANTASYNVKRAIVNGGPYVTVSTGGAVTTPTYTDTALTDGTTYYYVVSAVNAGGEGPDSTQVSVVPAPPVASPTNLSSVLLGIRIGGKLTADGIILKWGQSPAANVTQNRIYRSIGGGAYSLLTTISPSITYTDSSVSTGTTYNYKVTAYTSGGFESLPSNAVTVNY